MNLKKIEIKALTLEKKPEIQNILKRVYNIKTFYKNYIHFYYNLTEKFFKNPSCEYQKESIKLIYKNKIIAFLILDDCSINDLLMFENKTITKKIKRFESLKGVRSTMLIVDKKYQNKGIGSMILNYVKENYKSKYDYIWGIQHKAISNIDFFLKRREIILKIHEEIYTIGSL